MIRVRELSKTTIEVAGQLRLADRGGLTYVDIIANSKDEARAVVKSMKLSTSNVGYVRAMNELLDRMGDDDERTSLIDENGRRIEA